MTFRTRTLTGIVAIMSWVATPGLAQTPAAPSENKKLRFAIDFTTAAIHDNSLRASGGREQQIKVAYAIVGLFGDLTPHVAYRVEFNGVNDSVKPEPFLPTDETPFFFPNAIDPAYGTASRPEGLWKVDHYKNAGWDPYIQERYLRRAFVDLHTADGRRGLVVGRFFSPVGLQLDEVRWYTAKDLTHIQSINNVVDTGAQLYARVGRPDRTEWQFAAAAVTGNGNPYEDYVYFDHSRGFSEDTNSAIAGIASARVRVRRNLLAGVSYQYNLVGSRIERDTSLQRSKHYDNKLVVSGTYRLPLRFTADVFGEFARYKWGVKDSSAELLDGPEIETPIFKQGFYLGADVSTPASGGRRPRLGVVVTREEIDRDDSLVAFLAARSLYNMQMGKRERSTIVKAYVETGILSAFFFWNNLVNPLPQASAIVAISGPTAYRGYGNRKIGAGIRFRPSF